MEQYPGSDERAARLIDAALRDLPPLRAPRTLEIRVLDALEHRAAQPWWRHSFAHWPAVARAGFVALSVALLVLAVVVGGWTVTSIDTLQQSGALSPVLAREAMTLASLAGELAEALERAIPPLWLYSALAAGATLYAVLIGLGSAAYRTLFLTPLARR